MKRTLPLLLCGLAGLLMLLDFFVPRPAVGRVAAAVTTWTLIIAAASFIMGGVSVLVVNLQKARAAREGRVHALVLALCLAFMALLGILGGVGEGTLFHWIFRNVQVPMHATMFSLLAFFIASAAYRAFRLRNRQATVLLVAATFVMLGNVPLGQALWRDLPAVSSWVLTTPSLAAQRGLILGAALGAIATALRILLGIERGYLGIRD